MTRLRQLLGSQGRVTSDASGAHPASRPTVVRLLRFSQVVIDLGVLSVAFLLAYQLRFDWSVPRSFAKQMVVLWPWAVALQYACLYAFRVPNFSWRYIGLREVRPIVLACLAAAVVAIAARLLAPLYVAELPALRYFAVPLGIIIVDSAMAVLGITGVRALRRMHTENRASSGVQDNGEPTIIIGAGSAGLGLVKELQRRGDLGMRAVAFADDDRTKLGSMIHGIRVLGTTEDLAAMRLRTGATQALIAIARIRGEQVARIVGLCEDARLRASIIPPYDEIVTGRVSWTQIRQVAIEDLLGREPVVLDDLEPSKLIQGKVVMVTGAGGSIGSELCRQLLHSKPEALVLVEQAENSLFEIHRELMSRARETVVVPAIADVCDPERVRELFEEHAPQLVVHAAAHKHVPMMEANPREAIKNNSLGTAVVADLAHEFGSECFLLISTDKAVNPTSVMGCTKRIAEMYVRSLQSRSTTRFVSVRFGNVLGSAGSVIPIFKQQIARGGPVTVTHPDMVRYFMTIPEACQLVLEAASIADGGQVMVLDMGDPVRIKDLAEQMIRLSGFEPGIDIEVVFSGVRPGEKLFEELAFADEKLVPTISPRIFLRSGATNEHDRPEEIVTRLRAAVTVGECPREVLASLVSSYKPGLPLSPIGKAPVASSRPKRAAKPKIG